MVFCSPEGPDQKNAQPPPLTPHLIHSVEVYLTPESFVNQCEITEIYILLSLFQGVKQRNIIDPNSLLLVHFCCHSAYFSVPFLGRSKTNRVYKNTNPDTDIHLLIFVSYKRNRIFEKGIRIGQNRITNVQSRDSFC